MSWFGGSNALDEVVEKATDSSLPPDSEDLALNLEICDRIRSKAVNSKDAMRSLKKRISNQNPNVQLLALNLCDLCVKNGGSHFLVEIASREFVDNLVSMLRAPGGINAQVAMRVVELVQSWALAFESRSDLSYMMSTYRTLRNDGVQFPPEERVSAAFVDTAAPPDWADSDVCMRCRTAFTFRNRKHHCRNCGNVFCGLCSSQLMTLPQLGINEPVRVCDSCHAKRSQKSQAPSHAGTTPRVHERVPAYQQSFQGNKSTASQETEDLDLKRALELSLQESAPAHQPLPSPKADRSRNSDQGKDSEDEDLKAAIEASLRESAPKQDQEVYSYPSLATTSTSTHVPTAAPQSEIVRALPSTNSLELQISEQESINLFATLVERLKADSRSSILRDTQIQELNESVSCLRPKVARSLGNTVGKYESLVETHSKLTTVVKFYDRMLEARLASTYSGAHDDYATGSQAYYSQDAASHYGHESARYMQPSYPDQSKYETASQQNSAPSMYQSASAYAVSGNSNYARNRTSSERAPEPATPIEEVSLIDL